MSRLLRRPGHLYVGTLKGVGRVGLGGNDNAYAFDRVEHPMIVFDRSGNFLRSGVKASP